MNEHVAHFRNTFLAGLLTLVPIAVTIYVANWIFYLLTGHTAELLKRFGYPILETAPDFVVRLFGLLLTVALIWLVGLIARNMLGHRIIRFVEDILERVPMMGTVYSTVKQIGQALLSGPDTAMFRKVALIEYPKKDCYALGFLTADAYHECNEGTGRDLVSIFLPTTPNPTSGYLLFVPREKVVVMGMSVPEAMRLIISGGVVKPPYNPSQQAPESGDKALEDLRETQKAPGDTEKGPADHRNASPAVKP